ncbi:MAG: DUF3341 domain-containing protein [Puniceicoccaceae bacterium]|nr:MAG: DUF3341 domain-containing protein [Puniceicoccaceae bacterium]
MASSHYGIIAAFDEPGPLMKAAEQVRDAGYRHWDVITPFPVHGMDGAMGLKRSKVPRITFIGGAIGLATGMALAAYMNWIDYPLIVGGKPFFSPIYAFPVAYELTILLAAFGTIGGMFIFNRLPMLYHPVLKHDHIHRASDDRFYLVIEAADPLYEPAKTRALLDKIGGREIADLED